MTDQAAYDRARKRAKRKLDFYTHLTVYAVVIAFLFVINIFTSADYWWAFWPALGWGIAVAIHGTFVFLRTEEGETLDRMTERELERDKARHQHS